MGVSLIQQPEPFCLAGNFTSWSLSVLLCRMESVLVITLYRLSVGLNETDLRKRLDLAWYPGHAWLDDVSLYLKLLHSSDTLADEQGVPT